MNFRRVGDGPPLLMLHGFTGAIDAWQGLPERLAQHVEVIAVDMIGHGATSAPSDPDRYRIERAVEDLLGLLDEFEIEKTGVLGYSMGGRVALHLALAAPERVSWLVLESAAPGIDDLVERRERVASDANLAAMIEQQGIETFVDHWESIPLFESQRRLPADVRARQREIRLGHSPTGLANSLRGMGAGAMEPTMSRLHELLMPILYIAGELDTKYRAIGTSMVERIPDARYVEISSAGHTVHLEQPDAYLNALSLFLKDAAAVEPVSTTEPTSGQQVKGTIFE